VLQRSANRAIGEFLMTIRTENIVGLIAAVLASALGFALTLM
jgi:hypothetical protein